MVYRLINSTFNLRELLLRLTRLICQVLHADYCLIVIVDSARRNCILKAISSPRRRIFSNKKNKMKKTVEARIIRTGNAIFKDDMLGVPLITEDTIGAIVIKRLPGSKAFTQFDYEMLMSIGEQSVTAIKNLQLYEEQQKLVLGSIKSIVTLLEKKAPVKYTHKPFFSDLVMDMARELSLSERQTRRLKQASLLHDAGKVDIPPDILTKTEKLTDDEYGIIKKHPMKGVEIIKPLEILKPLMPIILHHHEKYDGSGYPSGLKKGQIPIEARIMAVADAFEAMTSGRPYRNTVKFNEAVEEIKENSGTQFDPKVVEAFLRIIKKKKFKKNIEV
jgi:HD-GYP domain-containing protein (c-di-GMP phosphodiesterase class II)